MLFVRLFKQTKYCGKQLTISWLGWPRFYVARSPQRFHYWLIGNYMGYNEKVQGLTHFVFVKETQPQLFFTGAIFQYGRQFFYYSSTYLLRYFSILFTCFMTLLLLPILSYTLQTWRCTTSNSKTSLFFNNHNNMFSVFHVTLSFGPSKSRQSLIRIE